MHREKRIRAIDEEKTNARVDEGRKRVTGIMAAILISLQGFLELVRLQSADLNRRARVFGFRCEQQEDLLPVWNPFFQSNHKRQSTSWTL